MVALCGRCIRGGWSIMCVHSYRLTSGLSTSRIILNYTDSKNEKTKQIKLNHKNNKKYEHSMFFFIGYKHITLYTS